MNADFRILEVRLPESADGPPPPVVRAAEEMDVEHQMALLGHRDLATPAESAFPQWIDQRTYRKIYFAAVPTSVDGEPGRAAEVLGIGAMLLPLTDNVNNVITWVMVRAAHRHQGLGSALVTAIKERARQEQRSVLQGWVEGREPQAGEEALVPPTQSGALAADASARFAQRHGFQLEQVERHSTLHLPVPVEAPGRSPDEQLEAWCEEARGKAGADYRLLQWQDTTPEQYLEAMAALYQRMSVDVPSGGLAIEEEKWDAERVRLIDERLKKARRGYVQTVVEHVPTGQLVAFTLIVAPHGQPYAFQEETLVHGDHRGKRLGLWVKAANLQYLGRVLPGVERIHTWNADENGYMLSINVRMGFRVASLEGAWQAKLEPPLST